MLTIQMSLPIIQDGEQITGGTSNALHNVNVQAEPRQFIGQVGSGTFQGGRQLQVVLSPLASSF